MTKVLEAHLEPAALIGVYSFGFHGTD